MMRYYSFIFVHTDSVEFLDQIESIAEVFYQNWTGRIIEIHSLKSS